MKPDFTNEDADLEPLVIPEVKSHIPRDLIENLSKRDQHTLETMSVVAQRQDRFYEKLEILWKAVQAEQIHRKKMQKVLLWLWGRYAPITYVLGIGASVAIKWAWEHLIKKAAL